MHYRPAPSDSLSRDQAMETTTSDSNERASRAPRRPDQALESAPGVIATFHRDQRGQVMVIGALLSMVFVFFWLSLFGIGEAVSERVHLQNTADAVAYSQALWSARWFNWVAYTNRGIVANYIIMTQFSIIHSTVKYLFDWIAILGVIGNILQVIPPTSGIGSAIFNGAKAVSKATAALEKFCHKLADFGIPLYHILNGIIHVFQNIWIVMLVLFPIKGNAVRTYMDPDADDDTAEEGLEGGDPTSTDGGLEGGSQNGNNVFSKIGQVALTAYTYYQYFMLLMYKSAGNGLVSKIGPTLTQKGAPKKAATPESPSAFNSRISVWKRWKWITEETAHMRSQGPEGLLGVIYPFRWDDRSLLNLSLDFSIDLGIFGIRAYLRIGGKTHYERWSLGSSSMIDAGAGGFGTPTTSPDGKPFELQVGLFKWKEVRIGNNEVAGFRVHDSFAHDYLEFGVDLKFPFVGWFNVFSIGVHEAEMTSELEPSSDQSGDGNPANGARDNAEKMRESARKLRKEAKKIRDETIPAIRTTIEDKRDEADLLSDGKGPDDDPPSPTDDAARAAELRAEATALESTAVSGSDSALGAEYDPSSEDTPPGGSIPQWEFAASEKDKAAAEAETAATQQEEQANQLSEQIDDVMDEIGDQLYHDGPVLAWWAYYGTMFGSGDGPSPRDVKPRFVFPNLIGELKYKDRMTVPTMWEIVTSTSAQSAAYNWATEKSPGILGEGRSPAHWVVQFRDYQQPIEGFGLADMMFGNAADESTPMLGDQYTCLSRAEVFYLHPLRRTEHPNLFNPFWNARLSPISKDFTAILDKLGVDPAGSVGEIATSLGSKLIPH